MGTFFGSSVCLLQTVPSGANIGVRCSVLMKKVHINVGNKKFLTKIVQFKKLFHVWVHGTIRCFGREIFRRLCLVL